METHWLVNTDVSEVLRALVYASERHLGQFRKGKACVPFIYHPIEVATLLSETHLTTDTVTYQSAILHDLLEDTSTSFEELFDNFGSEVASIVFELTDPIDMPIEQKIKTEPERAACLSDKAALIKYSDIICNVRDMVKNPPDWTEKQKEKYIYRKLLVAEVLSDRLPHLYRRFNIEKRIALEAIAEINIRAKN